MSQETKSLLLDYVLTYARIAAHFNTFTTWTVEYFNDMVNEKLAKLDKVTIETLCQVPLKDLEELGFRAWSDNSDLLLIPIYFVKAFKEDEIVSSIRGTNDRISDVSLVTRFGLIAHGFHHPELKPNKE